MINSTKIDSIHYPIIKQDNYFTDIIMLCINRYQSIILKSDNIFNIGLIRNPMFDNLITYNNPITLTDNLYTNNDKSRITLKTKNNKHITIYSIIKNINEIGTFTYRLNINEKLSPYKGSVTLQNEI